MRIVFTPAARWEIIDAYEWYEGEAAGLGARLQAEMEYQLERIASRPQQFPKIRGDVRRARLRKFPYGLFFQEGESVIKIIAFFHYSRNPGVWQKRV